MDQNVYVLTYHMQAGAQIFFLVCASPNCAPKLCSTRPVLRYYVVQMDNFY